MIHVIKQYKCALLGLTALALLATGCATPGAHVSQTPMVSRTVTYMVPPIVPTYEPGSLWSTQTTGSLFEDTRARRVGDLVMVRVVESASGTKNASTSTERDSSLTTGISAFFGSPVANRNINVGVSNSYDGTGQTARSGRLTALVAASVVELLPNGNLSIEGSREIQVNDEVQVIHMAGVVRPVDISTDNIVLSSRIADARITYTGEGVLDEKQRPGWFTRLFDYVTPF